MGELFALLTALFFAISVVLFKKGVTLVAPYPLNLFKTVVALALLLTTDVFLGLTHSFGVTGRDLFRIMASGALGVGLSDIFFLMALSRLGASRTALVDCLYSPFVLAFSFMLLGEVPPSLTLLAGALIIGAVLVSSYRAFGMAIPARQFWSGTSFGVLAMATVSFAIVYVQPVLNTYPVIWIATLRLTGGLIFLLLLFPFHPDRRDVAKAFRPQAAWKWLIGGTVFGTYLSLISWLSGFKYSRAGTAALLNQTSTIWIVLFAALFLREPLTRAKLVAVAMAFAGAAIILS
jgi:drug/metabolite transporter (DMT)-like permease